MMDAAGYERLAGAAQDAADLQAGYAGVFDPVLGLLGEGVITGPYGIELLQRVYGLAVRVSAALAGLRDGIEEELARVPVPSGCRPFSPAAGPVRGPLDVSDAGWPAGTVGIYPNRAEELITRIGQVSQTLQTQVAERALQVCYAADISGSQAFTVGEAGAELADVAPLVRARLDIVEHASGGHLTDAGSLTPISEADVSKLVDQEEARQGAADARALRAALADDGPDRLLRLAELAASAQAMNGNRAYRDALASQLSADSPNPWDRTETVRKILEGLLAPFDLAAGDFWMSQLKEVAGVTEEWVNEWGTKIDAAEARLGSGESIIKDLLELGEEGESVGQRIDAWYAFAPRWLSTAAEGLSEIRGFSNTMTGLGIAADIGTMVSPADSGDMGNVDRGVALINGGLLAADAAMTAFPVVGEVAIAATGMYLAGTYLYQHFTPFRDVARDIGHAAVHATEGVVRDAEADGHAVKSAWHSVTSTIGSWF